MSEYIWGRNSVIEAINSKRTVEKIYMLKGNLKGSIETITAKAKEKKIPVSYMSEEKMNEISKREKHQGVIALISDLRYFSIDEIIEAAQEKRKKPLIVVLDELEDPHNVGSIIRSCEATGVDGIVIQKRNGVLATATVNKSSAGALNHMKICKAVNISRTLKELKEKGFWIYGADGEADKYYNEVNYDENVVLVMGNEGFGIRPLVKKHCDFLVKLPMIGKISSLNVSNACCVFLYEILRQRWEMK